MHMDKLMTKIAKKRLTEQKPSLALTILAKARELGLCKLEIEFSGSDGDKQIDCVNYIKPSPDEPGFLEQIEPHHLDNETRYIPNAEYVKCNGALKNLIDLWMDEGDMLQPLDTCWCYEEGGGGTVTLDIPTGAYKLSSYEWALRKCCEAQYDINLLD